MISLVKLNISDLTTLGVATFNSKNFNDARGKLELNFEFPLPLNSSFLSFKESFSLAGVGRGLHYQNEKFPQSKIIKVKSGVIYDFLYDPIAKPNTVYFFKIDSNDNCSFYIPSNFAHGFIAITDVVFSYICIGEYSEKDEIVYNFLSDAADILELGTLILSDKDSSAPKLKLFY